MHPSRQKRLDNLKRIKELLWQGYIETKSHVGNKDIAVRKVAWAQCDEYQELINQMERLIAAMRVGVNSDDTKR